MSPAFRRALAIDVGERRVGVAISDATGALARPLRALHVTGQADAVRQVSELVAEIRGEEDGLATIVVGLPRRLDGSPSTQTARVEDFIEKLRRLTAVPIVVEDERLTSREAESRLATREKDWRKRKAQLDAAAAAIILQDYLDRKQG